MSHFADVLNDQSLWQSAGEKIRCLKAIQEMVIIGKSHVSPALPQINTCLHSAIENEELRSSAYMALGTMISCLDDEDVRDMMVSTLAITIHYWEHFDVPTRKYAREVVEYIANILPRIVGDRYAFEPRHLPSVESVPELADLQERLLQGSKCTSTYLQYFTFSKRFKSGNATVILRTFADMAKFLAKNQSVIQKWSLGEQFTDIIDKLFRAMLDASVKFNNSNSEIARLSAQCLGMIGCLDTNLFEAKRERDDYVVVSNFDEADDATDFAFYLLKNVLVQAFLSASSTKNQAFLSYTMQELLRICDISNAVTPDSRKGSAYADDFPEKRAELQEKWRELPDTVREILTPFLRSKYMPPNLKPYPVTYPIFKPSLDHKTWLRIFVRHLLEKQHNMNAGFIFPPLILAVRIEDTSVANCLLPYAALHTIVSGTDTDRDNIKGEIMNILRAKSEFNAHNELNNIKMCSEVCGINARLEANANNKRLSSGSLTT